LAFVDELASRLLDGFFVDEPALDAEVTEDCKAEIRDGLYLAFSFDDADELLHEATAGIGSPSMRSGSERMSSETEKRPSFTTARCSEARGPILVTPF